MADAQTIVTWVARTVWQDDHEGQACPEHQIPTEADLSQLFRKAQSGPASPIASAVLAFVYRTEELYRSAGPLTRKRGWSFWSGLRMPSDKGLPPEFAGGIDGDIESLHDLWREMGQQGPHPLSSLVRAWQRRELPLVPDRRRRGIMPSPVTKRTDSIDRLPPLTPPEEPGIVIPPVQDYLPRLHPDDDKGKLPSLLALFDAATDHLVMRGGAYLPLAIFVEALLSVPRDAPLGLGRVGPVTIGEIAEDWLQWNPAHYRPNRAGTGIALRRALRKVHNLAVPVGNRGGWYFPLMVRGVEGVRWNDRVAFLAEILGDAHVGPAVDRRVLRKLRKRSAPAYRGYLSLCFDWDYYAGHRGKLPLPTRPEVLRDPATKVLLNAEGTPILGAVIKDDEGRPRKDQSGNYIAAGRMPVKAWNDPRAVRTGRREPNPEVQRYRVYEVDDLVRLCYPVTVYNDQNTRRQARLMARRAIEVIEEKGGCIIEPLAPRGGAHRPLPWRILPPDLDGQDDSTVPSADSALRQNQ